MLKKVCIFFSFLLFISPALLYPEKDSGAIAKNAFEEVARYVKANGKLPPNFITKKEAQYQGWKAGKNLWKYCPGKSIGGDIFRNREGQLPKKKGRVWYEADINYAGGHRGKDRLLYSNDGLFYKTENHYQTFERIEP